MQTLLVVDDDRTVIHLFQRCFQNSEVVVVSARTAAEGMEMLERCHPDVVMLDIVLPDESGLATFERIHRREPTLPVVLITATGTSTTAIEAIKLGALDYLLKPLDLAKIRELVAQAFRIRQFTTERIVMTDLEGSDSGRGASQLLIGRCPAMQAVYKGIGRVAAQNVNVLIRGESGTGKELVARAIYQHSPRAGARFLAVNCAAIPEPLLESELFGHEKGAFTGADSQRIGKFEQCNGGTLFLDEVGDMPPLMQSKVLRVLQEQRFERVGGNQTVATDVCILTATHRDLEQMVARGQFRADLYYRLNGYTITLPSLRERVEDIPILVEHFLARISRELRKEIRDVHPDALKILMHYPWPGNVRELQSVLKQSLLQTTGAVLLPDFLPADVRSGSRPSFMETRSPESGRTGLEAFIEERLQKGSEALYAEALEFLERTVLPRVLRHTQGNQSHASKILKITRGSLRGKLRALGITVNQEVNMEDESPEEEEPADRLSLPVAGEANEAAS